MNNSTLTIDVNELSTSLTKKFDNLQPVSKDRCISRVPLHERGSKSNDHYTPQVVSIGPIHHDKKVLEVTEEHKIRYLQYFLRKRTKVRIDDFLTLIKKKEKKLRNCYTDVFVEDSDDFVKMILLDAVFLIEYFWRGYEPQNSETTDEDLLFGEPRIEVRWDLLMMENQIPLFILHDLFDLAKTAMHCHHLKGLSLITITRWFWDDIADYIPVPKQLLETNFSNARHLLEMLSLCFQSCKTPKNPEAKEQNIPSIKKLHQTGVKIIKAPSTENLLDITFNNGSLEIPFLNIYDNTERIYRNIMAFEHMHVSTSYFNDYVSLMSFFVTTAKDAELLVQNEVIGRRYRQTASTIFNSLNKSCNWSDDFQYSGLVEELNNYCGSRYHKWKAILNEKYFNTPWASLSVAAAVILLLLTVVQTTCSILSL